jgi:putative transposase
LDEYVRGISTRDIQTELEDLYRIHVSPSMISNITDKVTGADAD